MSKKVPTELEQAVLFLLDMAQGITCPQEDDSEVALYQSTRLLNAIRLRQKMQVDDGHSGPVRLY